MSEECRWYHWGDWNAVLTVGKSLHFTQSSYYWLNVDDDGRVVACAQENLCHCTACLLLDGKYREFCKYLENIRGARIIDVSSMKPLIDELGEK